MKKFGTQYIQQNFENLRNRQKCCPKDFDKLHKLWVGQLDKFFRGKYKYGRYAKIIAIYLKTAVVLPQNGKSRLCSVIHPPIDSILINNLLKPSKNLNLTKIELTEKERSFLKNIKWTQMTKSEYWKLVKIFRDRKLFSWELERYWDV